MPLLPMAAGQRLHTKKGKITHGRMRTSHAVLRHEDNQWRQCGLAPETCSQFRRTNHLANRGPRRSRVLICFAVVRALAVQKLSPKHSSSCAVRLCQLPTEIHRRSQVCNEHLWWLQNLLAERKRAPLREWRKLFRP